jgi:arylsulfatase A-like enzyme
MTAPRLLALCVLLLGSALALGQKSPAPPNVLVIIADDLGWNGVGYHNPGVTTPNIDRLAKEGVRLERFYGHPVCSPARAALLSGIMPRRFGVVDVIGPAQQGIPAGTATMASTFRKAGYRTSLIGKWHLGTNPGPLGYGFDRFYGFLGAEIDYFTHISPQGRADWWRDERALAEEGHSTQLLAAEAEKQLRERDPQRPFFMQVAFNAPHSPLAATKEILAKHNADGVYGAVIEELDLGVGRILAALDRLRLRESTIVVFCSDNGAPRRFSPNTPLNGGKDTVQEGGIRTPAIVRWPGKVSGGMVSQHPVAITDLYPTLLAAAGVATPAGAKLDGTDQWSAVASGQTRPRAPFLIASHDIAFYDGRWKVVETAEGKRSLFDLEQDVGETKDLSAEKPEMLKALGEKLDVLKNGLPPAPTRRGPPGKGAKGAPGKKGKAVGK